MNMQVASPAPAPEVTVQASQPVQIVKLNDTQNKMLALLGQGFPPVVVASSLGCSESYVSQMLSEDWFAQQVQELKFKVLQKHTRIDDKYDTIEERLLEKLERAVPLIVRPQDITRTLQAINGAKRRGSGSQSPTTITQNIVQLTLPTALLQKFVSNQNNQIIEVQDGNGQQNPLVTTTSGSLERLSREAREARELRESERRSLAGSTDSEDQQRQAISSQELSLLSAAQPAQVRLGKSPSNQGPIKAEDL